MSLDSRYTFAREYCGHKNPRWVARFCGDWIGQSETKPGAAALAKEHRARFVAALRGS